MSFDFLKVIEETNAALSKSGVNRITSASAEATANDTFNNESLQTVKAAEAATQLSATTVSAIFAKVNPAMDMAINTGNDAVIQAADLRRQINDIESESNDSWNPFKKLVLSFKASQLQDKVDLLDSRASGQFSAANTLASNASQQVAMYRTQQAVTTGAVLAAHQKTLEAERAASVGHEQGVQSVLDATDKTLLTGQSEAQLYANAISAAETLRLQKAQHSATMANLNDAAAKREAAVGTLARITGLNPNDKVQRGQLLIMVDSADRAGKLGTLAYAGNVVAGATSPSSALDLAIHGMSLQDVNDLGEITGNRTLQQAGKRLYAAALGQEFNKAVDAEYQAYVESVPKGELVQPKQEWYKKVGKDKEQTIMVNARAAADQVYQLPAATAIALQAKAAIVPPIDYSASLSASNFREVAGAVLPQDALEKLGNGLQTQKVAVAYTQALQKYNELGHSPEIAAVAAYADALKAGAGLSDSQANKVIGAVANGKSLATISTDMPESALVPGIKAQAVVKFGAVTYDLTDPADIAVVRARAQVPAELKGFAGFAISNSMVPQTTRSIMDGASATYDLYNSATIPNLYIPLPEVGTGKIVGPTKPATITKPAKPAGKLKTPQEALRERLTYPLPSPLPLPKLP